MRNLEQYHEAFDTALNGLNEQQRKAVELIDGPVMVLAGPGTGKTQVLAARIGNILRKDPGAEPQNILCLTYTDAGATAMRQRLVSFMGTAAYDIHICTFHAFAASVVRDFPEVMGDNRKTLINDLQEVELYHEFIDSIDNESPLKRFKGEIYFEYGRLKSLFTNMKKEAWSADEIAYLCNEQIADLPNRDEYIYKVNGKDFKKGDLKVKQIEEITNKLNLTKAAALEFDRFQQLMDMRGFYTYDDLILNTLKAFKENDLILQTYQEQFQYILVDEFQDTNGSQSEIMYALADYFDQPNLFVVGDDDQSIYRFQGANLQNLNTFYEKMLAHLSKDEQAERLIVLTENYRSTQAILDASYQLIDNNQERIGKIIEGFRFNKKLQAANKERIISPSKPIVRECYNSEHEIASLALELEQRFKNGENLDEIAVLYTQHKLADDLTRFLSEKNIPYRLRVNINVMESFIVLALIDVLTYIKDEIRLPFSREDLLFKMLHFPFFQIKPLALAHIAFTLRGQRKSGQNMNWREHLDKLIPDLINGDDTKRILQFNRKLEQLIADAASLPLIRLVEKILHDLEITTYVLKQANKMVLLQELNTFYDFIKQECRNQPDLQIEGLLRNINQMKKYDLKLETHLLSYQKNAINLSTVHSSKGLEFETVYLISNTDSVWEKKKKNHHSYLLPEGLVQQDDTNSEEDARRLFFVACTRAKENLIISYPTADSKGKSLVKSKFVEEWLAAHNSKMEQVELPDMQLSEFYATSFASLIEKPKAQLEKAYIDKALENFSLSVSSLNSYLRCPLSFYYDSILRVPAAKNDAMAFGSAVHNSLEDLFKQMKDQNGTFPNEEIFIKLFEKNMFKQIESFTPEEYKRRLEYGIMMLKAYYERYVNEWNTQVSLERYVNANFEGISLSGIIDKIEYNGNEANVIDYKTGKYENVKKNKKLNAPTPIDVYKKPDEPSFEELNGGDYWRQAVFYKILLDSLPSKNYRVLSTEFDFVEPSDIKAENPEFNKAKVLIEANDVAVVKNQIKIAHQNIMAHNFTGCGKAECEWCNFEKENIQK